MMMMILSLANPQSVLGASISSASKLSLTRSNVFRRRNALSTTTSASLSVGSLQSILEVKPRAKVLVVTTEPIRQRRSFQFLQSLMLQHGVQAFDYAAQPNHVTSVNWSSFGPDAVLQGVEIARRTGCSEIVALGGNSLWQVASCIASLAHVRDVSTRDEIASLAKKMEAPSGVFQPAEGEATLNQMPDPLPLHIIPTSPAFVDMAPPRVLFNPSNSELLSVDELCKTWHILVDRDMIGEEPMPRGELQAGLLQLLYCAIEAYESAHFAENSAAELAVADTVQLLNHAAEAQSITKQHRKAMTDISLQLIALHQVLPSKPSDLSSVSAFNRAFSMAVASAFGLDCGTIGTLLLPQLAKKWPELSEKARSGMGRLGDADMLGSDYAKSLGDHRDALQLPTVTSTLELDSGETFEDLDKKLAQHALAIANADYTRMVEFNLETFRSIL